MYVRARACVYMLFGQFCFAMMLALYMARGPLDVNGYRLRYTLMGQLVGLTFEINAIFQENEIFPSPVTVFALSKFDGMAGLSS